MLLHKNSPFITGTAWQLPGLPAAAAAASTRKSTASLGVQICIFKMDSPASKVQMGLHPRMHCCPAASAPAKQHLQQHGSPCRLTRGLLEDTAIFRHSKADCRLRPLVGMWQYTCAMHCATQVAQVACLKPRMRRDCSSVRLTQPQLSTASTDSIIHC